MGDKRVLLGVKGTERVHNLLNSQFMAHSSCDSVDSRDHVQIASWDDLRAWFAVVPRWLNLREIGEVESGIDVCLHRLSRGDRGRARISTVLFSTFSMFNYEIHKPRKKREE